MIIMVSQMKFYTCEEKMFVKSDNSKFQLHTHQEYEILMFFEGDSKYIIEDKTYTLEKDDVIIIRKNEMHRIFHNSPSRYHRIIIMVSPQFFKDKGCMEYENVFLESMKHTGNKINGHDVHTSGLYDAVMRLKKYSDNFKNLRTPLTDSILIEILYIINKTVSFSKAETKKKPIDNVISYINENYTQKITLDTLSEKFFISKYHLCRIFKEATGITILEYLRSKRMIYANELIENGYNMTEAANLSGFCDYSSFYRAKHKKSTP